MTIDKLPFPHRRGVEKLVRRFTSSRRGGLFLCVGACEDSSHRVVEAMQEKLGPSEITEARISPEEPDPWRVILSARTHPGQIVAARLADDPGPDTLRKLDVQRELLHQERVILLLWVSLRTLRTLADTAPNLWSVRRDVVWFLSYRDIQTAELDMPTDIPQKEAVELRLIQINEDIKAMGEVFRERNLMQKASLLRRMGCFEEAYELLIEAKSIAMDVDFVDAWYFEYIFVLLTMGMEKEAEKMVKEAFHNRKINPYVKDISKINLLGSRRDFKQLLNSAEDLMKTVAIHKFHWNPQLVINFFAPALAIIAKVLEVTGRLKLVEYWLGISEEFVFNQRANSTMEEDEKYLHHWPVVFSHVEQSRSSLAWERLDILSAMMHLQKSLFYGDSVGDFSQRSQLPEQFATYYASLGYRDEARRFREQAKNLQGKHPQKKFKATPIPYKPSPYKRLLRATEKAEKLFDEGRFKAIKEAFKQCQHAWQDEDPRYRSLYLRARWKKVEARWLVVQKEPQRAVAVLRETMEEANELPRTRLDLLVTLAQLGSTVDATVREAAAEEALSIALTAEALSVERDARRVLAPFARERGEETLAAFHEEEARKIDEALAPLAGP